MQTCLRCRAEHSDKSKLCGVNGCWALLPNALRSHEHPDADHTVVAKGHAKNAKSATTVLLLTALCLIIFCIGYIVKSSFIKWTAISILLIGVIFRFIALLQEKRKRTKLDEVVKVDVPGQADSYISLAINAEKTIVVRLSKKAEEVDPEPEKEKSTPAWRKWAAIAIGIVAALNLLADVAFPKMVPMKFMWVNLLFLLTTGWAWFKWRDCKNLARALRLGIFGLSALFWITSIVIMIGLELKHAAK